MGCEVDTAAAASDPAGILYWNFRTVVITKRNGVRIALCMRMGRFDVYRIRNLSKKSIIKEGVT